jgi:hypothetical protein
VKNINYIQVLIWVFTDTSDCRGVKAAIPGGTTANELFQEILESTPGTFFKQCAAVYLVLERAAA